MSKVTSNIARTLALAASLLALGLATHYYVRLHLMANSTIVIEPGKWVWVECGMPRFAATIEEVTVSGIVLHTEAERPQGIPCDVAGVKAIGNQRYVMRFRTVLGVTAGERLVWSNPFSI